MNVYELEKQATPCPIAPSCCEARNGYDTELFTEVTHTSVCDFSVFQARRKHDAKLLAHCRNNFMKALTALKGLYEIVPSPWLRELIAELEEVK